MATVKLVEFKAHDGGYAVRSVHFGSDPMLAAVIERYPAATRRYSEQYGYWWLLTPVAKVVAHIYRCLGYVTTGIDIAPPPPAALFEGLFAADDSPVDVGT